MELSSVMIAEFTDEDERMLHILSALHGKPTAYFELIPLPELKRFIREAKFIHSKAITHGVPVTLKIGKAKYNVELNMSNLISGQYIDLTSYCKSQESIDQNYHNIIALFLSPRDFFGRDAFKRMIKKGKTQDELIVIHNEITKQRMHLAHALKEELTMDKVFALANYFFLLYKNLMNSIQDYSEKNMKKAMKNLNRQLRQRHIPNIGVGI